MSDKCLGVVTTLSLTYTSQLRSSFVLCLKLGCVSQCLTGEAHGWVGGCGTLGGLDPLPGVHNNTVTICCAVALATKCCLSQVQRMGRWVGGIGMLGGLDPLPGEHNNTVTICCAVSLATNCCLLQVERMGGWMGVERWVALTLFLECTTTQSLSAALFHWQPTVVSHSHNLLRCFIDNQLLSLTVTICCAVSSTTNCCLSQSQSAALLHRQPQLLSLTVTICCAVALATNCCLSQSQSAALLHRQPTVVSHSHNLLRCFIDNHNCCLSQSQSAALLHRQPTVVSHSHNLLRCFIDNQLLSLTVTICCAASSTTNC